VKKKRPGERCILEIERDGKGQTVEVTFPEPAAEPPSPEMQPKK
jgi:hypothetical protein